jgi:hypothetical protein
MRKSIRCDVRSEHQHAGWKHVPHGSPAFSGEGVKKFAIFSVKSRTPVQTERSGVRLGGLAENHEF